MNIQNSRDAEDHFRRLCEDHNFRVITPFYNKSTSGVPNVLFARNTVQYGALVRHHDYNISLNTNRLVDLRNFATDFDLVPLVVVWLPRFDQFNCFTVTQTAADGPTDKLVLTRRQVVYADARFPGALTSTDLPSLHDISFLDAFHSTRVYIPSRNTWAPDWATIQTGGRGGIYYEVPLERDFFTIPITGDANLPPLNTVVPTNEIHNIIHDEQAASTYGYVTKTGLKHYLRHLGILGTSEHDITVRRARDRIYDNPDLPDDLARTWPNPH